MPRLPIVVTLIALLLPALCRDAAADLFRRTDYPAKAIDLTAKDSNKDLNNTKARPEPLAPQEASQPIEPLAKIAPYALVPAAAETAQQPPADAPQATETLRPEVLKLLDQTPQDRRVPVTVELIQELGSALRAEITWNDETTSQQLKAGDQHTFRLAATRHILNIRALAPPLQNTATVAIDASTGMPMRVQIAVEPRFNGADITIKVWRGKKKVSEQRFLAPER